MNHLSLPILVSLTGLALFAWSTAGAEPPFDVPYGRRREVIVAPAAGERVLQVGAWFRSGDRLFQRREAGLAINGRVVTARALLSADTILQPRNATWRIPRVDDRRQIVWFPWTHRPGGLHDFDLAADHGVYQSWVPHYRDFDESILIDLDAFPPRPDGSYVVGIYNNAAGSTGRGTDGFPGGPPLEVVALRTLEQVPSLPAAPYIAPIWPVLDNDPELEREARQRLLDPDTSPTLRAQLAFQFALRECFADNPAAAMGLLRQALDWCDRFPERNEAAYRLTVLDPSHAERVKPDFENDRFGWARLHSLVVEARAGDETPAIVEVRPIDRPPPLGEGDTWATLWQGADVRAVDNPVSGVDTGGNHVAFRYSQDALFMVFRGPGTEMLRRNNIPGVDRPVWEYNCVELFLNHGLHILEYFELNVSSTNARFDGRHRYHRIGDAEWNGEWQSEARIEDGEMRVEMRIPWSDLGIERGPAPGDLWLANVVRVQHLPNETGGWEGAELSLGRLGARDFHRLQDAVVLRFR